MIRCDIEGCPSRFHSYSDLEFVRRQALGLRWLRILARKLSRTYPRRMFDVCPDCAPILRPKLLTRLPPRLRWVNFLALAIKRASVPSNALASRSPAPQPAQKA